MNLEEKMYDAVMVSTGPSRKIDRKRTLDAISAIKKEYGHVRAYGGLWIPAGTLGGVEYERSQRKGIYDLMIEQDIPEDRIEEIGGDDTIHKTQLMIDLAKREGIETIGISTYWTHFLRYKMILKKAREEKYEGAKNVEFKFIRSTTTPFWRKPVDFLYGVVGLIKEKYRLTKYGFERSAKGARPGGDLTDKFKKVVGGD